MISASEIHKRLSSAWPRILLDLGIPESALSNKHGPCPACGGTDRFRFDNKWAQGNFICGQCGAGDGFTLLQRVYGWSFREAVKRVVEAAGLTRPNGARSQVCATLPTPIPDRGRRVATPTAQVLRLHRGCCALESCADAVSYLASRALWPLPPGCTLSAHAAADYFETGRRIGRFPALVADVLDVAGEFVTCHVTWLREGRKLTGREPRKILSGLAGRVGCAARLMPATEVLGIAEGIETALAAAVLDEVPVWASLNAPLLARFDPPAGVLLLRVYADRDKAGHTAALQLMQRLQRRLQVEIRVPSAPAKDWNDVLNAHAPQRPPRAARVFSP
jgi:putative DNA primase/helicase